MHTCHCCESQEGDRHLPDDFQLHVRWEEAWMKSIMENEGRDLPQMPIQITGRSLFASPTPEPKTTIHVQVPAAKAFIKKEPHVFNRRLLSTANKITMELDSHSGRNLELNKLPSSKSRLRLLPVHRVLWISASLT